MESTRAATSGASTRRPARPPAAAPRPRPAPRRRRRLSAYSAVDQAPAPRRRCAAVPARAAQPGRAADGVRQQDRRGGQQDREGEQTRPANGCSWTITSTVASVDADQQARRPACRARRCARSTRGNRPSCGGGQRAPAPQTRTQPLSAPKQETAATMPRRAMPRPAPHTRRRGIGHRRARNPRVASVGNRPSTDRAGEHGREPGEQRAEHGRARHGALGIVDRAGRARWRLRGRSSAHSVSATVTCATAAQRLAARD